MYYQIIKIIKLSKSSQTTLMLLPLLDFILSSSQLLQQTVVFAHSFSDSGSSVSSLLPYGSCLSWWCLTEAQCSCWWHRADWVLKPRWMGWVHKKIFDNFWSYFRLFLIVLKKKKTLIIGLLIQFLLDFDEKQSKVCRITNVKLYSICLK